MKETAKLSLTLRTIKAIEPRDEAFIIHDDEMPGFYLRVSKDGDRTFYLKYRVGSRQRKARLGRFGDITPDEARKVAARYRQMAHDGKDPQAERDEAKRAMTVNDAWSRFVEVSKAHWRGATNAEYERQFKAIFSPTFGTRTVASIDRATVAALHHKLRDKPVMANRVIAVLSSFLSFCRDEGIIEGDNPCSGVRRYKEKARERVLSDGEIARLGAALDAYDGNVFAKAAIRLILLLGCRKMEVLGMRWTDVDLDAGIARLPETKTGARTVYIGPEAVELLRSLPRLPDNPFVIPGHIRGTHMRDVKTTWATICETAKIEEATIHDLRRTYGSRAVSNGADLFMVSKLLGHSTVRMTEQAYAFMKDEAKAEASREIAAKMSEALAGKKGNVVPLRKAGT